MELALISLSLLIVLVAASYVFHQRIKLAASEYEASREMVENITRGFTRQLLKTEAGLDRLERETDQAREMALEALKKIDELGASEVSEDLLGPVVERIEAIDSSLEELRSQVQKIAAQRIATVKASNVAPPIPIKEEDVLQSLTETELKVLEVIQELGEASGPDVQKVIGKTREHTARLLKKLYEKGFIDRNTSSIPYRYSLRKEVQGLLLERSMGLR
ncbi:MAG TPA: MarR family transcriptional regulator [Candidatus Bathyarchaeota archaeon]|nr:MarR family transcriptional regulator [Candidatus Bathyarchaeota archaeon]